MNIKTRHGYETPLESDLEDYQLGWSINDGCLYIKDPQTSNKNKVLRVLSDKALLDANQKFIGQLQESLNKYSDEEISRAKEELKSLYEKKTTYVIEFGLPAEADKEEGVDYTTDTEFDYYTKETADEAVAAFIEKLNTTNIGNQDPDIKNAGSKIIISKADHSVAYLYMILEDEYGKEYGQLINTLEQSFPSLVLEWSEKKENTIDFKLNNEVLNSIDFSSMVVDEGSWRHGEKGTVCLTSKDDLERASQYIEYVSPICFYAKENCTVRPSKPEIYDAYAYGYNSLPIREETFTGMGDLTKTALSEEEINFIKTNGTKPIKISQPISEFTKRGQYYSIFRIKHAKDSWVSTASFTSAMYSSSSFYSNSMIGMVEYYNNNTSRWEGLYNLYGTSETWSQRLAYWSSNTANSTTATEILPLIKYSGRKKSTPILGATSKDPIKINTTTATYENIDNSENPSLNTTNIVYGFKDNGLEDASYIGSTSNKLASKFSYNLDNKSVYTSDIKIPFSNTIKLDKGYDYIMLEALDLNSRAYIVPMYENKEKTKIKNQLVDILQIIESTSIELYLNSINNSSIYKNTLVTKQQSTFNLSIPFIYIPTTLGSSSSIGDFLKVPIDGDNKDNSGSITLGSGFSYSDKLITLFTPDNDINIYNNGYNSELSKLFLNNAISLGYYNMTPKNKVSQTGYSYYSSYNTSNNAFYTTMCTVNELYEPIIPYSFTYVYPTKSPYNCIPTGCFASTINNPKLSAISTSNIYGFARNFDAIRIMELDGE